MSENNGESQAREKPNTKALYKRKLVEIKERIENEYCSIAQNSLNQDKRKDARRKAKLKHGNQHLLSKVKAETTYFIEIKDSNLLIVYKNEIIQLKNGILELTNHKFYSTVYAVGLQILLYIITIEKQDEFSEKISELRATILKDEKEKTYIGINEIGLRKDGVSLLLDFATLLAKETYNINNNTA